MINKLEMFVQETQTQVKHHIDLAWLYLNVSLLLSRDTVTLLLLKQMLSEPNRPCTNISILTINHHHHHHHYQSVLPKGRSFTANSGTKAAVLPKGRSSTANSGTKVAVLQDMSRCGGFPLLSAPHSLFSIWTDLKRSVKIPGAPTWRWEECIWLTVPSGLHRKSLQGYPS